MLLIGKSAALGVTGAIGPVTPEMRGLEGVTAPTGPIATYASLLRVAPFGVFGAPTGVPTGYPGQLGIDQSRNLRAALTNSDGLVRTLPDAVALTDNMALPVVSRIGAVLLGFNGSNWDFVRTAITAKTSSPTGILNAFGMGVYKAAAETLTDGQTTVLTLLQDGSLRVAETRSPGYEDNTNAVAATVSRPLAVNTYVYTAVMSAALEASHVLKATPGCARSLSVRLDATAPTGTYYVQVLNYAALPANGAVNHLATPVKLMHISGIDQLVTYDFTANCIYGSVGIVVALSTTEFTLTISGAYLSIDGRVI